MTPSPLTNAMNDVMSSLQDMTVAGQPTPPDDDDQAPKGIWSPEAFDQIYATSAKKVRPKTSLGVGMKHHDSGYGSVDDMERDAGPPQLDNYVQRMESRLRQMQQQQDEEEDEAAPPPPLKNGSYDRPKSSVGGHSSQSRPQSQNKLRTRKSAYELGRAALNRTFTNKSSSTNATNSTQRSLMSGASASAFSATSAGSLARRKFGFGDNDSEAGGKSKARPLSAMSFRNMNVSSLGFGHLNGQAEHASSASGISYHSSHATSRAGAASVAGFASSHTYEESGSGLLGGLSAPTPKKRGFFKKLVDGAKTGAASARSTISSGSGPGSLSRPQSRAQSAMGKASMLPNGVTAIAGGTAAQPQSSAVGIDAARDMGLGGGMDWVQVRRDVNRSNTISRNERSERLERAQMMEQPALAPVELLEAHAEGDEGLDGLAICDPTDFASSCNLQLVDKSARFVANLPPTVSAAGLSQGYVCRPYRSDVQRLRAIFTWVSERVAWEEDFELDENVDTRRVVQTKRGCSQEIAALVAEMCAAVGLCAEVVRGYLKTPGEELAESLDSGFSRPNHWWNAVIVDGEWRIMDAALASPTNPKRGLYSPCPGTQAEGWYFLARPIEACYTHVPLHDEQQHIVPPMEKDILLTLPTACPPYFKHGLRVFDYDTSHLFLENLEMVQIQVEAPEDVECVAEMEVREFARDADGDFFESGEMVKRPALCQAEWFAGRKRWIVKATLPGDEGRGVLKIYSGKRGLMVGLQVLL